MFQPLYIAATGLKSFQDEIMDITNNLSNAKTTAFKRGRTEMESLFYVDKSFKDQLAEAMSADELPKVSPEYGTGVRVAATSKDFIQGSIETTSSPLDVAIQGDGFLQVKLPDGTSAYTRAGNLHADNEGNLVDANGHPLDPPITLPSGTTAVTIHQDGTIYVSIDNQIAQTEVGQITLAKFPNMQGLKSMGQNLFASTAASGDPVVSNPGSAGFGTVSQYALESSNVDVISEMMRMVMVQRVFDTLTKAVASYEGMLTSLEKMKS
ncbi:MAG TPA: flagellar basal-body rod protein FlgG [Candidatus Omnitrophota bacterium]|nr:flagellar basal-body rod protein FlgG [Candidatus Omnitrophota bacterium]